MIRSMTAFARQERQGDWGVLVWELRAVNQRYLELTLRLPDELKALETPIRERANAGEVRNARGMHIDGPRVSGSLRHLYFRIGVGIDARVRDQCGFEIGIRQSDVLCARIGA